MPPKKSIKRKRSMKNGDYSPGIKSIAGMVNDKLKLKTQTIRFLNELMVSLNGKLVEQCAQKMPESGTADAKIAQAVLQDVYPGELFPHALAEAQKDLFSLENNLIVYQPATREPKFDVAYSGVIKSISRQVNNKLNINKKSIAFLNNLMNGLNEKLVNDCREKMPASGEVDANVAEATVRAMYPGELLSHAISEAVNDIFLPKHGLMPYDPIKGKKAGESPKAPTAFTNGIKLLTSSTCPHAKLNPNARIVVENILENITKGLAEEAKKKTGSKNKLETDAIRQAIVATFPNEMGRHAQAEGAKSILANEYGFVHFKPRK